MRLSAQADPVQHPTLLVSSSRYAGNVSSVVPGVTVTGGVTASYDGSLPNVFLNEIADPSFGITSGITLDAYDIGNPSPQAHPLVGTPRLVGSLDVTAAAMAQGKSISTSFPSKSELALHISTDGTSVSLMGYAAPINQLDVSNSNTPSVIDPSNPVTSTTPRAIADLALDGGALTLSPTSTRIAATTAVVPCSPTARTTGGQRRQLGQEREQRRPRQAEREYWCAGAQRQDGQHYRRRVR